MGACNKRVDFRFSPIGFGAFKIGRNRLARYPKTYQIPGTLASSHLLNGILDLGVNYIDTAPAYGSSERKIGEAISHRRDEYYLSTKVGERFHGTYSTFDFSREGILNSVAQSLINLRTDYVDLLLIHSNGNDLQIIEHTDAVETLTELKRKGLARKIGMSPKTVEGTLRSIRWADAVMVEFNLTNLSLEGAIRCAYEDGVAVIVKKALASGTLDPAKALPFLVSNPHTTTVLVGSLSLEHMRRNVLIADSTISSKHDTCASADKEYPR